MTTIDKLKAENKKLHEQKQDALERLDLVPLAMAIKADQYSEDVQQLQEENNKLQAENNKLQAKNNKLQAKNEQLQQEKDRVVGLIRNNKRRVDDLVKSFSD
mgnify:CR=1 FL=1|tara:strand:+ start:194 stop:499 length:306 start_codon:yes stop_codon:yes gene_type:complete